MTIVNNPKPSRAARLAQNATRSADKKKARGKEQVKRRLGKKRIYGGVEWVPFRESILTRDRRRCTLRQCETPYLGLEVHHIKSVGSGGKSVEWNCITLCRTCHERAPGLGKVYLLLVLLNRYGYAEIPEEMEKIAAIAAIGEEITQ